MERLTDLITTAQKSVYSKSQVVRRRFGKYILKTRIDAVARGDFIEFEFGPFRVYGGFVELGYVVAAAEGPDFEDEQGFMQESHYQAPE